MDKLLKDSKISHQDLFESLFKEFLKVYKINVSYIIKDDSLYIDNTPILHNVSQKEGVKIFEVALKHLKDKQLL